MPKLFLVPKSSDILSSFRLIKSRNYLILVEQINTQLRISESMGVGGLELLHRLFPVEI